MKIDVKLSNAKIYDVNVMDIAKGEKFSLRTDYTSPSKWFSDNDPVLELKVSGDNADLVATDIGSSTILIMDENLSVLKRFTINVLEAIVDPASDLNIKGGKPVNK